MKTIIVKFGGSSLADPGRIRRAAAMLLAERRRGFRPVAVVSAPADCTDDLLKLAAATGGKKLSPRECDALLASGEQISAALVALALQACGAKSVSLTGLQAGIRTDASFSSAGVLSVAPARLRRELAAGRIPVVAGFQGVSPEGDTTTLGRGGSDLSAVVLARALKAARCDFRTDVKGIYTAHPAVVPAARKIREISYAEVIAMAELGTEVRQLRAVKHAARFGIPLHLRSSFHEEPGTLVTRSGGRPGVSCLSVRKAGADALVSLVGRRLGQDHLARALAAGAPHGAAEGGISPVSLTLRVPASSGESLLKTLHAEFF